MNPTDASLNQYVHDVQTTLVTKQATEPSYYPAVKQLVDSLGDGITATVLPKKIDCGAPDFVVTKGQLTVGYIEAKDIGVSLDVIEKSEQLGRYRHSLPNLILTNYLEFRWYQNGERILKAELGTVTDGKVKPTKQGREDVAQLVAEFLSFDAPGVRTARELARSMAHLAHRIREGAEEALNKGVASDMLTGLHQAFQETLIPGLEVKVFADMYAQTIAYGLFAARCETNNAADFSRQKAAYLIPKTNPFLKALFEQITGTVLDDEPYKWAVDELVQLLKKAEMAEVMKGFGKAAGKDDPVVYFYEDFLREYDKKLSEMRGVYYTPIPVVSYIVRSIDYLLKYRFHRPQGLADEKTYILDPATGTGTFLYAVINEIYESMSKQGQTGKWDGAEGYVAKHLLPRIFGFELLMAPYVIAHLKLGLQLKDTHYQFQSNQRLGVYLTNTLEEAVKSAEMLMGQYIVKEANAAADIKKTKPIMVVLGNPPYSGISANRSEVEHLIEKGGTYLKRVFNDPRRWIERKATKTMLVKEPNFIGKLLVDYYEVDGKPLEEKNPKWLQDDYVKFIRFGQWRIKETGEGILAFITNHSYLDNPTFRGMRQSLMKTFTDIYILNLHGNTKKKELAPNGGKDENVFDIQQGVAIGLLVKEPDSSEPAKVHYAELWGLREGKYQALLETNVNDTGWTEFKPSSPFYLFVPRDEAQLNEYEKGWKVTDIFSFTGEGFTSHRDDFAVNFALAEMEKRLKMLADDYVTDETIRGIFNLEDTGTWKLSTAREVLRNDMNVGKIIQPCLYRPFDRRFCLLDASIMDRPRMQTQSQMMKPNLALSTTRNVEITSGFSHVLCVAQVMDRHAVSLKEINYVFPLYLYPVEKKLQADKSGGKEGGVGEALIKEERKPNLTQAFIKAVSEKLALKFVEDGKGDLTETFGPEDIFNYAYAVFHSPAYRTRYAEFLKIDFPRLPLTSDKKLFQVLAEKGAELVSLHLMESPALNTPATKYPIPGSSTVEQWTYDEKTKRVKINKTQYFEGVPLEVWNFHVGGYQVCQKWLKDRKGRTLSADDITHYQKIVVALKETIRLMAEIDSVILQWPVN